MDRSNSRVAAMDGWRGISISLVILYHMVEHYLGSFASVGDHPHIFSILKKVFYELMLSAGPLGVRIFFVISGFIITHLLIREEKKSGGVSLTAFYRRRIFRILPAFYCLILAVATLNAAGYILEESTSFFYSSLFLCDIHTESCGFFLVHTWSLAVEEQFYLVWPFVFIMCPARYRIIPAALSLISCILMSQLNARGARLFGMPISFASISAGACLALSPIAQKIVSARVNWVAYALCFIAVFFQPVIYHYSEMAGTAINIVQPILLTVIVFKPVFCDGYIQKALENRLLVFVGTISYSLYLWQAIFTAPSAFYPSISWLQYPELMVIPALASYYLIEKPAVRLGAALKAGRSRALSVGAPDAIHPQIQMHDK